MKPNCLPTDEAAVGLGGLQESPAEREKNCLLKT